MALSKSTLCSHQHHSELFQLLKLKLWMHETYSLLSLQAPTATILLPMSRNFTAIVNEHLEYLLF